MSSKHKKWALYIVGWHVRIALKKQEEEDVNEEVEGEGGGGNETKVKGDGTVVMVDHFS